MRALKWSCAIPGSVAYGTEKVAESMSAEGEPHSLFLSVDDHPLLREGVFGRAL